ncbi:MAG TPA: hypothetical protein ENN51_01350 [candidate division WOR-3 bacterium]|uniref:T9SS type A sorting domain-containing protein n=1 Tax=candidate division WOR-3 bacterium TaxID=2052148 RepID=A0A7V0T4B9_UNCW3|nr:hypothetical protein [candidate division WOR-3 bacterium]
MQGYKKLIAGGLLLLMFGAVLARTATTPPGGERVYDMKWLNINRWLCPFHNDGRYAYDPTRGSGEAGGSWPQPYKNMYIFGAGLWFGSLKTRDDGGVDTLVSFGYNPNAGNSEMSPFAARHVAEGAGNPDDRMYVFPSDWPPPADRWDDVDTSLVPQDAFSLQDMWCVYSDVGEDNHIAPGYPQGIEVYQTIYAWNYPANQDIFFIVYKVRNVGDDTLRNCYMGALMDPDIGEHADDMLGLLLNDSVAGVGWVRDVGFAGDYNNMEVLNPRGQWEEGTPGVVAYKFLESPRLDPTKPVGPDNRLGMTSFKMFTIEIDPVTDPAQYLTMAGYDYRTGVFSPYDSIDLAPADKRFIQSSGPFNLGPDQVEELIVATIAAPYGAWGQSWEARKFPYNDSLVHLARLANTAQFIYDQGWLLPGPPPTPNVTLVPGDNTVRIVWDDLAEKTPDTYYERVAGDTSSPGYDPKYLKYDFQGYVIYKSKDGANWGILAQYDKADSILFEYPPGGDSALPESLWIKATDTGVRYSVVDDEVVNGFSYYYCVTAYDWNYITTEWDTTRTPPVPVAWDTLILRSGIIANWSTIPRWNPVNYRGPETFVRTELGDTVNPGLKLTPNVVIPYEVEDKPYRLRFLAPEYLANNRTRYRYLVDDPADGALVVDTTAFSYTVGASFQQSVPVFNGQEMDLTLRVNTPPRSFDTAYVLTGSYPQERVRAAASVPQQALWALRGSDYRIEWTMMEGTNRMTARVFDETHGGLEVPYAPFSTMGDGPRHANGWAFVDRVVRNPSDTLKTSAGYIYICGGVVALNWDDQAGRADTLGAMIANIGAGDEWMVYGNKTGGTAPMHNVYELTARPGYEQVDSTYKLNVKVVPNPYIVFDEWERSSDNRMLKFTNLPHNCVIRVFTTSGDLVQTLHHSGDGTRPHQYGGTQDWDLLNSQYQLIAAGIYIFHVESDVGEFTGKFAVIH